MANNKLTPQESFYAPEVLLALPITLQVNVVRRPEHFGVECESLLENIAVLAERDQPVKAARQVLRHPTTAPEAQDLVAGRKRLDDVEVTQGVGPHLIRFVVRDIEFERRGAACREGPAERVLEKLIAQSADQSHDHHISETGILEESVAFPPLPGNGLEAITFLPSDNAIQQ